jgi:purine-binding chemotaxis protein CheW
MNTPATTAPPPANSGTESGGAPEQDVARWLVVESRNDRFAIPVSQVREVVRAHAIRRVPGAPGQQAGIINVRGAIVTVLDLAALRGAPRAVAPGSIVLLQHGTRPVGLAVDAVLDVHAEDAAALSAEGVEPLNAVALCARHLHLSEETAP